MQRKHILSNILLAGLAIASLSTSASATPITVTRGPNGAASIVNRHWSLKG
jgi:hypothetical protein